MRAQLICGLILLVSGPAFAAGDEWQDHGGMIQTRIIAAPAEVSDGAPLFAWEAKLAEGWKTYWRSPGEAGLPLVVTSGGEALDLLYPLPERFTLFDIETYGYGKSVLVPFALDVSNGPANLTAEFMVCKDICVPFQTQYTVSADMAAAAGLKEQLQFETWLPQVPAREDYAASGLSIDKVRAVGQVGRQKLIIEVSGATRLDTADILVEGAPGLYFKAPVVRLLGDGTKARLVIDIESGRAKVDVKSHPLRLTFTNGTGDAIDQSFDLAS